MQSCMTVENHELGNGCEEPCHGLQEALEEKKSCPHNIPCMRFDHCIVWREIA